MDSNEIDRSFSTTSLASALKTGVASARLGKTTQKIFHRWLFIAAFIIDQNFRSFIFHFCALYEPNLSFSSSREVPVEGRLRISN